MYLKKKKEKKEYNFNTVPDNGPITNALTLKENRNILQLNSYLSTKLR